jgi:hydrogenase expression/formation protein HypE
MARAGSYGLRLERDLIPVLPVIRKTAELFDFDMDSAISEGTLIAIVSPDQVDDLIAALADEGIEAAACGEIVSQSDGLTIISDGEKSALEHPVTDPYWTLAAEFAGGD